MIRLKSTKIRSSTSKTNTCPIRLIQVKYVNSIVKKNPSHKHFYYNSVKLTSRYLPIDCYFMSLLSGWYERKCQSCTPLALCDREECPCHDVIMYNGHHCADGEKTANMRFPIRGLFGITNGVSIGVVINPCPNFIGDLTKPYTLALTLEGMERGAFGLQQYKYFDKHFGL